jgi:uncharacterized protein
VHQGEFDRPGRREESRQRRSVDIQTRQTAADASPDLGCGSVLIVERLEDDTLLGYRVRVGAACSESGEVGAPATGGFFPVVSLTGPRQSGKTTLVRSIFPDHAYLNLENLDDRRAAEDDPIRFLTSCGAPGAIIDEAQRVPDLFSYLQGVVDEQRQMGRYVLTGSQNFLLLEKITQSLAGRVGISQLMPCGQGELQSAGLLPNRLDEALYTGGYPVLYDRGVPPTDYFPSYIQTYIERDVRSITNVGDLGAFRRFVQLCAGRSGQLLNLSSLGSDLAVNYKTVRSWIAILEASSIVFTLQPYHRNFGKRLVKQPKVYFYDTGLLCALLGVRTADQLATHYLRGSIFETYVIAEHLKRCHHAGQRPNAWFWRDNHGHEIDLILEDGQALCAVEAKSAETLQDDLFRDVAWFRQISPQAEGSCYLVHGGTRRQSRRDAEVLGWRDLDLLPLPGPG